MKKFLFLGLAGSVIFFNSCSSNDDSDNTATPKLLLSKVTTTYYDNPSKPETVVEILEYDKQGQLVKMNSKGRISTFEYIDGKPTKINYYNDKNILEYYLNFYYKGDQLLSNKAVYTNSGYNRSYQYTYNTNGQLASSTLCQSENCSNPGISTFTYNGSNVSVETSTTPGSFSFTSKSEFTYDSKLNPHTNTNKYLRIMMGGANTLSANNYTVNKDSYKGNDGNWYPSETTTYTLQYNSSGLPVQATGIGSDGNLSVQYTYEYITQ